MATLVKILLQIQLLVLVVKEFSNLFIVFTELGVR